MSIEAIRTEIDNDPARMGYAGKTVPQIVALMNRRDIPFYRIKTDMCRVLFEMASTGTWNNLLDLISDALKPAAQRRAAVAMRDLVSNARQMYTDEPRAYDTWAAMLATMVTAGVMNAAQRQTILDYATVLTSRAEMATGYTEVSEALVTEALALLAPGG